MLRPPAPGGPAPERVGRPIVALCSTTRRGDGQPRRLKESDDVAARVVHRCDQLAPTDISERLLCLCASVEEQLQTLMDVVNVPFVAIATIVGRSPAAARQLASRARCRVQGVAPLANADLIRQREVVDAFLAASRGGDFAALLALLDPDVVLRADHAAVQAGAVREVRGAPAVADTFARRARFAQAALVSGAAGAVWAPGGRPRVVFDFTIAGGMIVEIDLLADPERLRQLDLTILQVAHRAAIDCSPIGGAARMPLDGIEPHARECHRLGA